MTGPLIRKFKQSVPWQAKIAAKLILSRLPVANPFWKRLGLFEHGSMERPEYAYRVCINHFDTAPFIGRQSGFVALELGPGDTLFSAMISKAFGASKTYLVDMGSYATADIDPYRPMGK